MIWEAGWNPIAPLCKARSCYISLVPHEPFSHTGAAGWLPWERGKIFKRKKWPFGGLKLLLKAPKVRSWTREEFPLWLHWEQCLGQELPVAHVQTVPVLPMQGAACCYTAPVAVNYEVSLHSCDAMTFQKTFWKGQTATFKGMQTKFPADTVKLLE